MSRATLVGLALAFLTAQTVLADSPDDTRAAIYQSYAFERTGNIDQAMAVLAHVAATPGDYLITIRLGWLNYLRGNYTDSAAYYGKAKQIIPTSLEADLGRLNALMAQNRLDEAAGVAQSVVSVDHFNYYGNLHLARIMRLQGKLEAAERICSDMLAIEPLDVTFLTELGLDKQARNDHGATAVFARVLLLDPENSVAKGALPASAR